MNSRSIARTAVTAGVGLGAALILAGAPVLLAVAGLALFTGAAMLLGRYADTITSVIRARFTSWLERDRTKKGSAVERA